MRDGRKWADMLSFKTTFAIPVMDENGDEWRYEATRESHEDGSVTASGRVSRDGSPDVTFDEVTGPGSVYPEGRVHEMLESAGFEMLGMPASVTLHGHALDLGADTPPDDPWVGARMLTSLHDKENMSRSFEMLLKANFMPALADAVHRCAQNDDRLGNYFRECIQYRILDDFFDDFIEGRQFVRPKRKQQAVKERRNGEIRAAAAEFPDDYPRGLRNDDLAKKFEVEVSTIKRALRGNSCCP